MKMLYTIAALMSTAGFASAGGHGTTVHHGGGYAPGHYAPVYAPGHYAPVYAPGHYAPVYAPGHYAPGRYAPVYAPGYSCGRSHCGVNYAHNCYTNGRCVWDKSCWYPKMNCTLYWSCADSCWYQYCDGFYLPVDDLTCETLPSCR